MGEGRSGPSTLLPRDAVKLGLSRTDRLGAVRTAGDLLVELGAVQPGYAVAMFEREARVSSSLGQGFAIPHGTNQARSLVNHAALCFLQYPEGIDWDGPEVKVCVGIAAAADEHIAVMSRLARIMIDPAKVDVLHHTDDPGDVLAVLAP